MKNPQKSFVFIAALIGTIVVVGVVVYFATDQQGSFLRTIPDSALVISGDSRSSSTRKQNSENLSTSTPRNAPDVIQDIFITVPIRVHLLQSSYSQVQTTITPDEVRAMFDGPDGVNKRYWNQYGINLKIESIVKNSATNDSGFAQAIAVGSKPLNQQFVGLIPTQNTLLALDFVVVRDFGVSGGGLTLPKRGVMLVPESSIKGTGAKIMTFGFAHEFGHTLLGGSHFSNSIDPYNMMAVGNPTIYDPFNKTRLTQDQIATAQAQAKKGIPNLTRAGE